MADMSISPEQSDYSFTDDGGVVAIEVEGGHARYRRDILNGHIRCKVSWKVDPDGYAYLRAFYRSHLNGGTPFTIDLILLSSELTTHTAWFLPGTFSLTSKEGNSYTVAAELEVVP
jgi:hypothetical protein